MSMSFLWAEKDRKITHTLPINLQFRCVFVIVFYINKLTNILYDLTVKLFELVVAVFVLNLIIIQINVNKTKLM